MNKKQRNRKLVKQNKRNRIVNRRYTSTIKSLTKLFNSTLKKSTENITEDQKNSLLSQLKNIMNRFYSIVDKAVKKGIVHRNTAARKKSNMNKLSKAFNIK